MLFSIERSVFSRWAAIIVHFFTKKTLCEYEHHMNHRIFYNDWKTRAFTLVGATKRLARWVLLSALVGATKRLGGVPLSALVGATKRLGRCH